MVMPTPPADALVVTVEAVMGEAMVAGEIDPLA
jgi:hypothetical protein